MKIIILPETIPLLCKTQKDFDILLEEGFNPCKLSDLIYLMKLNND